MTFKQLRDALIALTPALHDDVEVIVAVRVTSNYTTHQYLATVSPLGHNLGPKGQLLLTTLPQPRPNITTT